jgi:hypothetical protein
MIQFKKYVLILFFILTAIAGLAQSDKDVKLKDVPQQVQDFIRNNYPGAGKIEYYKEIEGDTVLYEAGFSYKTDRYNLLLFPDGRIFETEIVTEFDELPASIQEAISRDLKGRYSNYRIRMVEQINPTTDLKYEIKVRAKKGRHRGYFEVYYDSKGNFLEEEEEILRSIPSNSGF